MRKAPPLQETMEKLHGLFNEFYRTEALRDNWREYGQDSEGIWHHTYVVRRLERHLFMVQDLYGDVIARVLVAIDPNDPESLLGVELRGVSAGIAWEPEKAVEVCDLEETAAGVLAVMEHAMAQVNKHIILTKFKNLLQDLNNGEEDPTSFY